MLSPVALMLLFASGPSEEQASLPRHLDPDKTAQRAQRDDRPTDPWFDRAHVATDDPAFILAAVESARQGVVDARDAASHLEQGELKAAAEKIGEQNAATLRRLEKLAGNKGWRLPQPNAGRRSSMPVAAPVRANANFILSQLSFHEATVAQYRAQLSGQGDADLKHALRDALPGYQKNLDLLLTLKP